MFSSGNWFSEILNPHLRIGNRVFNYSDSLPGKSLPRETAALLEYAPSWGWRKQEKVRLRSRLPLRPASEVDVRAACGPGRHLASEKKASLTRDSGHKKAH